MNAWMHTVGWVLVHFVWQGAALGIGAALALSASRRHTAVVRYRIGCVAMAGMLAATCVTASIVYEPRSNEIGPRRYEVVKKYRHGEASLPIRLETPPSSIPGKLTRADVEEAFPWLVGIWLTGTAVLFARAAVGWWRVRRVHRLALRSALSRWQTAANRIGNRLGIACLIRIVELPHVDVPFVVGCLRPVIVLPIAAIGHLDAAQVEAILAHELAHVRRHDYLVNLLQTVAETLLFYHPAVWWLSSRIREEREHCCDDVAVEVSGDPIGYAHALAELETLRVDALALAPAATGAPLLGRVRRILRDDSSRQVERSPWAVVLLVMAGILATVTVPAQTQQPTTEGVTFEVASVRPNVSGKPVERVQAQPGGRYQVTNMPLRHLIINAYGLQGSQLIGAPDWTESERFDIAAKAAEDLESPVEGKGPSREQLMMRSLLAERFRLSVHWELREMPIYHLMLARSDGRLGPELKPAAIDCRALIAARGAQWLTPEPPKPGERPLCGARVGFGELAVGSQPLLELVAVLSATVQRNVVDRTGLAGNFDLHLKWTPDVLPPRPAGLPADQPIRMNGVEIDPNGPSIFTALQEQLGLKLEAQRGPVEVLVIDRVERPTPD